MPKISIIVPIYNVEQYIHRCIESILNQSISDIEIILVDDGSLDKCGEIADEYAKIDNRIKVIHKKNGGLSSARNAGIEAAVGEYLGFVDSDDWIESKMYEDMYGSAIRHESDLVICNYSRVYEDKIISNHLKLSDESISISEMGLSEYFYRYFFDYIHGYEVWNKVYKREVIMCNNLRFEEKKDEIFSEDLLFNLYYICHVNKISSLNSSFYNYLHREGSLMSSLPSNLPIQYAVLVEKFSSYCNSKGKNKELDNIIPILYVILIKNAIIMSFNYKNNNNIVKCIMSSVKNKDDFIENMKKILFTRAVDIYCEKMNRGLKSKVRYKIFALLCILRLYKLASVIIKM